MAKLNELALAGESVDALKRRFIRQNREIARTNSAQSLRIRNLEAETSRMLSENITLREENIQLKRELENRQSRYALQNVTSVRDELETKVEELGALISKLKEAETARPPRSPVQRRTSKKSLKRSPNIRDLRNPFEFTELDAAEGRLPPILEDKCFPRRSLTTDSVSNIIADGNDIIESPELGPPPVAHFEEGDPVKRDTAEPASISESPSKLLLDTDEDGDATARLFANLETRRRRRDSSSSRTRDNVTVPPDPESGRTTTTIEEPMKQPLKAGAKRKLAVRDDGEKSRDIKPHQKDDFSFNRRSDLPNNTGKSSARRKQGQETQGSATSSGRARSLGAPVPVPASRRALGEKSVNTDPVTSPVKAKSSANEKPCDDKKSLAQVPKTHFQRRDKKPPVRTIEVPEVVPESKVVSIEPPDLHPITPAPPDLELFSPESSNPPTATADSRDTPPPTDLGATGRTSRRRATNISYAEPNLRDKMRRPGKELVDAITDVKLIRSTSLKSDGGKSESDEKGEVPIKKEEEDAIGLEAWKPPFQRKEPTSPLGAKSDTGAISAGHPLPRTTVPERRHRMSTIQRFGEDVEGASNDTIAALVAGGQKRMARARESASSKTESIHESKKDSLSVFDFRPSSPELAEEHQQRHARKATSNLELGKKAGASRSKDEIEERNTVTTKVSRRRDTLVTNAANGADVSSSVMAEDNDGKGSLRAERAERRRSMMV